MDLSLLLPTLLAIALVFVLAPVAGAVYSYYRGPKVVRCPDVCREALVRINAFRAGVDAMTGRPVPIVESCSLWPRRRDCAQRCVTEAMRPVRVRAS